MRVRKRRSMANYNRIIRTPRPKTLTHDWTSSQALCILTSSTTAWGIIISMTPPKNPQQDRIGSIKSGQNFNIEIPLEDFLKYLFGYSYDIVKSTLDLTWVNHHLQEHNNRNRQRSHIGGNAQQKRIMPDDGGHLRKSRLQKGSTSRLPIKPRWRV